MKSNANLLNCQNCNSEPGRHPHMRWGGSLHWHGARECYEEHAFCYRLDCNCGRSHSNEKEDFVPRKNAFHSSRRPGNDPSGRGTSIEGTNP